MDLNSLLEAVGLQNDRAAEVAASVTGNYEQIKSIGDSKAVLTRAAGENNAIVATQKGMGELQAQENKRAFATSIGSNMDLSSEMMTSLGLQLKQATQETIAAKARVADKASVSIFDNPLQYIINQITIGDDINAAEAAQGKSDQIASSLAQINQSTQSTALSQNAIAQTTSAAGVQASASSIRAQAEVQAKQIEQENLLYNIKGVQDVQALNQQQLGNMFNAQSASNAAKSLENAQASLAISRANHKLVLDQRMEALDAKRASATELEDMGNTINVGRGILGLPPIPAGKAVQLMKIGGELGNSIKDQYAKGAVAESTGVKVISDQPGKAALTVAQSQAPLAPGMKPVKDLMMNTLADVAQGRVKAANGLPVDPKNMGALVDTTNGALLGRAKVMSSNIKTGDANNIYAAPTYQSITKTTPGVMETALYTKILEPLVNTGLTDVVPEQVITLTSQAIMRGDIDFQTAAKDIKTLFSAAALTNNVIKDYVRVGLPSQNTYNTTVTVTNANTPSALAFATNQNVKVNMIDQVQVSSILTKQLAASRIKTLGNMFTPNPNP